jgi:hypothetical protein
MPIRKLAPNEIQYRSAQNEGVKSINMVSPVGGLNFRDPLPMMGATDAVQLDNFICKGSGVKMRAGYAAHYTGNSKLVGTIMPYQSGNFSDHRLFAAIQGEILDVTEGDKGTVTSTAVPYDNTGEWSYVNYSLQAKKYLVAVNNGGGYWVYDPESGWAKQTIQGLPNDNLTSVSEWQNRIWITVQGYSSVFYLGIGEVLTGAVAQEFDYGPMFKHGGNAQVVANWSHDSGSGPSNYQVILSTTGDAVVYKGTDPDNLETYQLVGTWYVGNIPKGDKFFSRVSGDLYILTDLGIISMAALTSGKNIENGVTNPIIGKVYTMISNQMSKDLYGDKWELRILPWLDIMIITAPRRSNGQYRQAVQCISSGQWSTFTGVPIYCSEIFDRRHFFSDQNGVIYEGFNSDRDGEVAETETLSASEGTDVVGSILTAFNDFGAPTNLKRFLMVRPLFIGSNPPQISVNIMVDYQPKVLSISADKADMGGSLWDTAIWDEARWVSSANPYASWVGVDGVGYMGALQLRVKGNRNMVYAGSLIQVEVGGLV